MDAELVVNKSAWSHHDRLLRQDMKVQPVRGDRLRILCLGKERKNLVPSFRQPKPRLKSEGSAHSLIKLAAYARCAKHDVISNCRCDQLDVLSS